MNDEDIRNLLGGFATGNLTPEERQLLFNAALKDQELFNALADEEVLRDFLSDPGNRLRLLRSLEERKPGLGDRLGAWLRRPVSWAVAGGLVTAVVLAMFVRPFPPHRRELMEQVARERREKPAAAPKMKVAMLDFQAGPAQAKEAETASDLLGKKLDSQGYTVVDRKRVDQALQ